MLLTSSVCIDGEQPRKAPFTSNQHLPGHVYVYLYCVATLLHMLHMVLTLQIDHQRNGRFIFLDWPLSSHRWGDLDAHVVCRQLGMTRGEAAVNAEFGQGTGPILLDSVDCNGDELFIADCSHDDWGVHDCTHGEDAGAICGKKKNAAKLGILIKVMHLEEPPQMWKLVGHTLLYTLACNAYIYILIIVEYGSFYTFISKCNIDNEMSLLLSALNIPKHTQTRGQRWCISYRLLFLLTGNDEPSSDSTCSKHFEQHFWYDIRWMVSDYGVIKHVLKHTNKRYVFHF